MSDQTANTPLDSTNEHVPRKTTFNPAYPPWSIPNGGTRQAPLGDTRTYKPDDTESPSEIPDVSVYREGAFGKTLRTVCEVHLHEGDGAYRSYVAASSYEGCPTCWSYDGKHGPVTISITPLPPKTDETIQPPKV
ncbi:MAG TPA: hypothetical protein VN829_03220 [Dongiaceae bacterium]|nr:hypothetical protein [Dongiaceae bacterium]